MHQKYPHLEFRYELTLQVSKDDSPISHEEFEDIEEEVMEKITTDYNHRSFYIETIDIYGKEATYCISYRLKNIL